MQHFNSKKHQNKRVQEPFILYTERQIKEDPNYETSEMNTSFHTMKSSSDLYSKQPKVQSENFNRRLKSRENLHQQFQSRINENNIQQTKLQLNKFQFNNGFETFLDSFN